MFCDCFTYHTDYADSLAILTFSILLNGWICLRIIVLCCAFCEQDLCCFLTKTYWHVKMVWKSVTSR